MRLLRWVGVAVAGTVVMALAFIAFVYVGTERRIHRHYEIQPGALALPAAPGAVAGNGAGTPELEMASVEEAGGSEGASAVRGGILAWGEHVATTRGCTDCHGADLGGAVFADAMPVFRLYASNLTPGGVAASYTDQDWVRSIRHGVGPDGKPLLFMPSYEYYYLGDRDLASLVEYLTSLDPVGRPPVENAVGPVGRVLFMTGKLPLLAAEMIPHDAPRPETPQRGATVEYGAYLAVGCTGCHGSDFAGGPIPGVPPEWPEAANITPDPEAGIGGWTKEDFFRAMREGKRPDGTDLKNEFMPWKNFARYHDDELEALWLYISKLPQGAASQD